MSEEAEQVIQKQSTFGSYLTLDYKPETGNPYYICGSCGARNVLSSNERVSCKNCGYKILYKARRPEPRIYEGR